VTQWAAAFDEHAASPVVGPAGDSALTTVQRGLFDEPTEVPAASTRSKAHDEVVVVDARGPQQSGGARFGELVHAILATAPLDADARIVAAFADVHSRILSAPPEEAAAAARTVSNVLEHHVLGRARAAQARGACRRETPITCTLPDGTMIEGVVDLAFEEHGTWTVVDYKTDRELAAAGEDRYRRQVALYASAIAQATGCVASGILIRL
jgi:ATP-dependent exoDNAse (exonuclease V) beta subunit